MCICTNTHTKHVESILLFVCIWFQVWLLCIGQPIIAHTCEKLILLTVFLSFCSSSSRGETPWNPSLHLLNVLWCYNSLFMNSFLIETVSEQTFWYSGSHNISTPLLDYSLRNSCRDCAVGMSTGSRLFKICWSLHYVHLLFSFSMMVFICCKDRLLWLGVIATLICGYKDKIQNIVKNYAD